MAELVDDRMELLKDISKLKNVLGDSDEDDDDDDDEEEEEEEEDDDDEDEDDEDREENSSKNDYYSEENWSPEGNDSSELNNDGLIGNTSNKKDYLSILQNDLNFMALEPNNDLKMCLLMNQCYQNALMDKISQLETILESNLEHQKNLLEEIDVNDKEKHTPSGRKTLVTFQAPYFKDVNGQYPPLNEDAKTKFKNREITAYVIPNKSWTDVERTSLEKAVASNFKEKLLDPLFIKKTITKEKLALQDLNDEEYLTTARKLEEIQAQIANIKAKSKTECIGQRGSNLDWMKISVIGLNGNKQPEECELMWNNLVHPSINKEKWTEAEKKSLLNIAEKYQYKDWDTIAEKLQTNRTAWQCLQKYQKEVSKTNTSGPWTKEEDNLLVEIVEACRVGNYVPWHQVAYYLEGRSKYQIQERWKRTKLTRKGQWRILEDMILVTAVKKHGEDWIKVAQYLPGRTNNQCRERYKNSLEENLVLGSWTADEDKKLMKAVNEIGEGKWAKVARYLPGRTDNSIYQRYRLIKSKVPNALDSINTEGNEEVSGDKPLTRTVSCQKKIERRNIVYRAIHDQVLNLKMEDPSTSTDSVPENLNGIDITTINKLLNKMLPSLRASPPNVKKKSKKEKSVDAALDAFLLPLTVNTFQKPKIRAMGVAEAEESTAARSLLYKYFGLENVGEKDEINEAGEEMKKDMANLFKSFIIGKDVESPGDDVPLFPPNRTTLNSFKLFLSNRKQLVLSSKRVRDVDAISSLTGRTARTRVKCAGCLFNESYNLSRQANIPRTNHSYSARRDRSKNVNNIEFPANNECDKSNILSCKRKPDDDPQTISKRAKFQADKSRRDVTDDADEIRTAPCYNIVSSVCIECEYAQRLHDDFQLLKKRFLATFFWPGLLSTVRPNYEKPARPKKKKVRQRYRTSTPRKKKKPWVADVLRKRHLEQNHKLRDERNSGKKSKTKSNKRGEKPKPREVPVPEPTRRSLRQAGKPPADGKKKK